jgi:hypothetical protein
MAVSELEQYQVLEIQHNIAALGIDELRDYASRTEVDFWDRKYLFRECAVFAIWASELNEAPERVAEFLKLKDAYLAEMREQEVQELIVNGTLLSLKEKSRQFSHPSDEDMVIQAVQNTRPAA